MSGWWLLLIIPGTWLFLLGGAVGAWVAHVRGYRAGLRDGRWENRLVGEWLEVDPREPQP